MQETADNLANRVATWAEWEKSPALKASEERLRAVSKPSEEADRQVYVHWRTTIDNPTNFECYNAGWLAGRKSAELTRTSDSCID